MVERCRPFTDEASKYTGASSKSKPVGKKVLALAAVRHEKSSPLISAEEKTRSDVKSQENPGQPSGDQIACPSPTRNQEVTHPGVSNLEGYYWVPKREQHDASSSSGRNESHNSNA